MALLHHLLETATVKVPVLDRREGMPKPGRMQVLIWPSSVLNAFDERLSLQSCTPSDYLPFQLLQWVPHMCK